MADTIVIVRLRVEVCVVVVVPVIAAVDVVAVLVPSWPEYYKEGAAACNRELFLL